MEKDIYDLEVERLQAIPDEEFRGEIYKAWQDIGRPEHSPLFDIIGHKCNNLAGCLTQIRSISRRAYINGSPNEEITQQIHNDERIPRSPSFITKESLPVFAEWQRKIKSLQKN